MKDTLSSLAYDVTEPLAGIVEIALNRTLRGLETVSSPVSP